MNHAKLIALARAAGEELYGDELYFNAAMCLVKRITYEEVIAYRAEDTDDPPEEIQFSTYDYVFFPVSGRPPMDVADYVYLHDPIVYDVDGNCYYYCGEEDAVYIMRKEQP